MFSLIRCKVFAALGIALLSIAGVQTLAGKAAASGGDVLLTVSGQINPANGADVATFDISQLRQLDPVTFTTTTIWTEGAQTFTGVPLKTLLESLGVKSGTLRALAANDYSVDIPVADALKDGPIVAYERNGKAMPLRDKGPLWIVYPFDESAGFRTEVVYSRSIWQLDRFEVVD